MKTPSPRMIERAAENLGEDLSRIQKVGAKIAGHLVGDSGKMAKRARYKLRNGAGRLVEIEDGLVASMRQQPLAYILVTLGLACVVFLKIVLDRQKNN